MINRRVWLGATMLGGLLSACFGVGNNRSSQKRLSLAEGLSIAQTSKSEAELIGRLGPPHSVLVFNPGDPSDSDFFNRMPRAEWKRVLMTSPSDLIDTLPVGTKLLSYWFEYAPLVTNPTSSSLQICVDQEGVILGYIHPTMLKGYEKEALLRKSR